jgi:hypothetical protein
MCHWPVLPLVLLHPLIFFLLHLNPVIFQLLHVLLLKIVHFLLLLLVEFLVQILLDVFSLLLLVFLKDLLFNLGFYVPVLLELLDINISSMFKLIVLLPYAMHEFLVLLIVP